jgi:hypothetical protein
MSVRPAKVNKVRDHTANSRLIEDEEYLSKEVDVFAPWMTLKFRSQNLCSTE